MKSHAALLFLLSVAAGSAHAVRVANEPAPKANAIQAAAPASGSAGTTHADDAASLREGVIGALGPAGDKIVIQGTWLNIVDGKTRIFRRGTVLAPSDLRVGTKIKFTLAPGPGDRTTLGVVYVP